MDVPVGNVFVCEFSAARSEIAFIVPVALQVSVDTAHHSETTNVKLPVFVQKRLLYVFLDDVAALVAVYIYVLNDVFNVIKLFAHVDAAAAVRVLARLNDPDLLAELGVVVEDGLLALVRVVIELLKLKELRVVEAFFDVEGQRQVLVVLLADGFVVHPHVVVDGFLVA